MDETSIVEPEISDLRISNKLTVSEENLTIVTSSDEGIFDGDFDEDSLLELSDSEYGDIGTITPITSDDEDIEEEEFRLVYDNQISDQRFRLVKVQITWISGLYTTDEKFMYLWFVGNSPFVSNHDIYKTKNIDNAMASLRFRGHFRRWIKSDAIKFTRLKDFDETFYTELIDLVKFPGFQEELKLTSLDNLAKLISGTRGAKFGESLLKLEELTTEILRKLEKDL